MPRRVEETKRRVAESYEQKRQNELRKQEKRNVELDRGKTDAVAQLAEYLNKIYVKIDEAAFNGKESCFFHIGSATCADDFYDAYSKGLYSTLMNLLTNHLIQDGYEVKSESTYHPYYDGGADGYCTKEHVTYNMNISWK